MSPITHTLISWLTANVYQDLNRRERLMITIAGILPDIDGLGFIGQYFSHDEAALNWYYDYHHVLAHNLVAGLVLAGAAAGLGTRRGITALLALVSFHLHILGDLVGSRGFDAESLWPVHYLYPFSDTGVWLWSGQWPLVSWQNFSITVTALLLTLLLACRRGYSPLELISPRADNVFVSAIRQRCPLTLKQN